MPSEKQKFNRRLRLREYFGSNNLIEAGARYLKKSSQLYFECKNKKTEKNIIPFVNIHDPDITSSRCRIRIKDNCNYMYLETGESKTVKGGQTFHVNADMTSKSRNLIY